MQTVTSIQQFLECPPELAEFRSELAVLKQMLQLIPSLQPDQCLEVTLPHAEYPQVIREGFREALEEFCAESTEFLLDANEYLADEYGAAEDVLILIRKGRSANA
jgi:hypothetical protein